MTTDGRALMFDHVCHGRAAEAPPKTGEDMPRKPVRYTTKKPK